jgi:hypothetical protein
MFSMRKQSSETQSISQTEWIETNSIKKLTEISNKQKKEGARPGNNPKQKRNVNKS